jgi:hypothetical protein
MIEIDNITKCSIIFYIIATCILYLIKPRCMFDNDSKFKQFGLDKGDTIFPFWLVSIIIGLFIYLLIILNNDNFIGK